MSLPKLSLKKGRDWQLKRGHPWLFSGGISQAPAKITPGDLVNLVDIDGRFVACGFYNPACDIAVRILTLDPNEIIDAAFIKKRVQAAQELRSSFLDINATNAYRLINAEGDYLPGFIVDRFNDVFVVQSHTAGSDKLMPHLISALEDLFHPKAIVVRNDARARLREKLELEPPRILPEGSDSVATFVLENSLKFKVDPISGQKTGFFVDQRDKREVVQQCCLHMPSGAVLANCFSYSAGFSVYPAIKNASLKTINIDKSAAALELARENFNLNGCDSDKHEFVQADAFEWLEEQKKEGRTFDFLILDPPAFAKTHKDRDRAIKAYINMNTTGLSVCAPGGFLLTCSCSGCISLHDLETCLQTAAGNALRSVQILQVFKHGIDHPTNAAAPETQYLKAILCRIS